ncbi:MAG: peptidyl-prolyl cis-trans isomerase [Bacillota bacterium]|nr:peptidyl-prolyl cis-trans isomerase [Bacillota bacterium]
MTGWSKQAIKMRLLFLGIGLVIGAGTVFVINLNAPKDKLVAAVDGKGIKESEINSILVKKSGTFTLQKQIDRLIIENAAKSYGISVSQEEVDNELKRKILMQYHSENAFLESLSSLNMTPDEAKEELRIEMLFDRIATKDIKVSNEEINKYFKSNKDKFTVPEKRRVSEIVLSTEADATMVRQQLMQGADFKTLAAERSIGTGRDKGGDRGFMIKGTLNPIQPEVERVVFQINQGEVSPVIKASDGFHIIVVNEITPKYEPDFDSIKDSVTLKAKLEKCKPISEILADLRKAGKVEIKDSRFKIN